VLIVVLIAINTVLTNPNGARGGEPGKRIPPFAVPLAQEAERLGFDSLWTAEAYGSDCFTPLAWWGAQTSTIKPVSSAHFWSSTFQSRQRELLLPPLSAVTKTRFAPP